MVVFPNCKINLGLRVLRKREDGFHDLDTVFYPLALQDALEIIPVQGRSFLTTSGTPVPGKPEENICMKAYHLLRKDYAQLPNVHIHLHKKIPMGAGVGGGSSDAAFALLALDRMFQLELTTERLMEYALQLGSDCPFFIRNEPCSASGRGEQLQPLSLDLSSFHFVIVHPGFAISTSEAFRHVKPSVDGPSCRELVSKPLTTWKDHLANDFESSIGQSHPAIRRIKEMLYQAGALYAAMSGSGSVVFGIFKERPQLIMHDPAWTVYYI